MPVEALDTFHLTVFGSDILADLFRHHLHLRIKGCLNSAGQSLRV
jgi:hypothetical protein